MTSNREHTSAKSGMARYAEGLVAGTRLLRRR